MKNGKSSWYNFRPEYEMAYFTKQVNGFVLPYINVLQLSKLFYYSVC